MKDKQDLIDKILKRTEDEYISNPDLTINLIKECRNNLVDYDLFILWDLHYKIPLDVLDFEESFEIIYQKLRVSSINSNYYMFINSDKYEEMKIKKVILEQEAEIFSF